jgi:hypothetical protein
MTSATRRHEEIALGAGIALLGAVFLWQAFQIPQGRELVGPRSLPVIVAGLLVAGGLLVSLRAWSRRVVLEPGVAEHKFLGIVVPGVAVALAFLWLWSALGWTLASIIVAPVFFFIFGARGWRELVIFPAGAVASLYLVFYELLGLWHGSGWLVERLGLS